MINRFYHPMIRNSEFHSIDFKFIASKQETTKLKRKRKGRGTLIEGSGDADTGGVLRFGFESRGVVQASLA